VSVAQARADRVGRPGTAAATSPVELELSAAAELAPAEALGRLGADGSRPVEALQRRSAI